MVRCHFNFKRLPKSTHAKIDFLFLKFTFFALYFSVIDHCQSEPCKNGQCINQVGAFICKCNAGYTGKTCNEGNIIISNTFKYKQAICICHYLYLLQCKSL